MQIKSLDIYFASKRKYEAKKEAHTEQSIAKRWKEQVLILIRTFEYLDSAAPKATYF